MQVFFLHLHSLHLQGVVGGGSSSTQTSPDINGGRGTAQLYIKSAVYDNNRTATTADDRLYIYFNKAIDENSIAADTSANYNIHGTGAIGSAAASDYNDTLFHRHTITQDDGSTGSLSFSTSGDTNISLAQNIIMDTEGRYPSDYNKTMVEKFIYIKKTGQITSYQGNGDVNLSIADDGHYQSGVTPSYTRDAATGIVTDNLTGLMWQDNELVQKQWLTTANYNTCAADTSDPACYDTSGDTAATYCSNLTLGGFIDWRLPTSSELEGIVDYGKKNPAIDAVFLHTSSSVYWSSTSAKGYEDEAWHASFFYGYVVYGSKGNSYYVRCVRDEQ